MKGEPENLIYGLIDPRTILIRYVGLSSTGLKRPRCHRRPSCADTYCRRWVRELQRAGLDYEITILEVVDSATKLAETERWWIAFGRACGWPLTNLTEGGGPSEEAVLEKWKRRAAWEAAEGESMRRGYSPEEVDWIHKLRGIPQEIERQGFQFLDDHFASGCGEEPIAKIVKDLCVRQWTASELYKRGLKARTKESAPPQRTAAEIRQLCHSLFEEHIGKRTDLVETVASQAGVPIKTAQRLYKSWLRTSMRRGKEALKRDQAERLAKARAGI